MAGAVAGNVGGGDVPITRVAMRLVDLGLVQFQPETLRIAAEIEDTMYGCDVPGYLVVDGVGETSAQ
jgi:hypothetical protein